MDLYALNPKLLRLLSMGSAIGLVVMMCAGMSMAGLLPPPGPDMPAVDLARHLAEDATLKRTGILICMIGIALYGTWCAVITLWIRRMEEGRFPVIAWASAILCGCGVCVFEAGPLLWVVAAFRPLEISPEITQAIYELGWFAFLYSWPTFTLWFFLIAVAIFRDKHVPTLLPRWVAYLAIWTGVSYFPAALIGYFKSGLFAFNGLGAFWLPFVAFCILMVSISFAMVQSIKREQLQAEGTVRVAEPVSS